MKLPTLTSLLLLCNSYTYAQLSGRSPIVFNPALRDTAHYATNWSYNWYIAKDSAGKFHSRLGKRIKKKDTVHQFFSAHLYNTFNGGSTINFCKVAYSNGKLILYFYKPTTDPKLIVEAASDSFTCVFKTNPTNCDRLGWTEDSITKHYMALNTRNFKRGNTVSGYLNIEYQRNFHSNTTTPSPAHTYVISGYFSVTIH